MVGFTELHIQFYYLAFIKEIIPVTLLVIQLQIYLSHFVLLLHQK